MEAREVTAYLHELCRRVDRGEPLSGLTRGLGRILRPVALPAAVVIVLGTGGCLEEEEEPAPDTEICSDAIDNDGDGMVDCDDSDCATSTLCYGMPFEENCADAVDDDGDGLVDCDDDDCDDTPECAPMPS